MCERLTVLARCDQQRHMLCCEHGITHLVWDHASLRLPTDQLARVGRALGECATVARHLRIAASEEVCVILDQHDLYQVWLCGMGLCLSQADFQAFCAMVTQACRHRIVQTEAAPAPSRAPIRTSQHLFSLN